ncbi:hypothetical protein CEXT_25281 [Caerostris extrusa]|uniref:Uncharacterized protein n=1 Tax=Caerostris extrusa TaxID=172846 RepID=A0AAV4MV66_CAEEX|nr:hypothetical protein CEXT_25281 [Caerostris extrusa]
MGKACKLCLPPHLRKLEEIIVLKCIFSLFKASSAGEYIQSALHAYVTRDSGAMSFSDHKEVMRNGLRSIDKNSIFRTEAYGRICSPKIYNESFCTILQRKELKVAQCKSAPKTLQIIISINFVPHVFEVISKRRKMNILLLI